MTQLNHILFVDDNPGDHDLAREALEESKRGTQLHAAYDGGEALEFLRRQGKFALAPRPNVVLLDFNMPRKGGIETLIEIREDSELHSTPVIIFSSSSAPKDSYQAYIHNANAYLIKPADISEFIRTIYEIETAWCGEENMKTARRL